MKLIENHQLKEYNTFGVEAKAKFFSEIASSNELNDLILSKSFSKFPHLILGGGSNILFTQDFNGIVIYPNFKGVEIIREDEDFVFLRCGASEVWDDIVRFAVEHNYGGIENLALIPGSIGAAPIQNIGAYGAEIKDAFYCLHAYNLRNEQVKVFDKSDCNFGYRQSIFKKALKNEFLIFSVTLRLKKNPKVNLNYQAIKNYFEEKAIRKIEIKDVYKAVVQIRNSKLPDHEELGNAGSFFKNPIVYATKFKQIKLQFADIVGYNQDNGTVKLAAGWLIEKAGWKGKRIGNAGIHDKQALVIVNYGGATGEEILELSKSVQKSVFEMFDIKLDTEVNII